MARRRGFFAELQHQQRLAEQRRRREEAAAVRAYNQALREAEASRREQERARAAAVRAHQAERAAAERFAREAHRSTMTAEAALRTAEVQAAYAEIDSILQATLDVDDYVDVAALKKPARIPKFSPGDVATPTPWPEWVNEPPEPRFTPPPEPTGMGRMFSRARYEQEFAEARQRWEVAHRTWLHQVTVLIPAENNRRKRAHEEAEERRLRALDEARRRYQAQCDQLMEAAAEQNAEIDHLIAALGRNEPWAVDEYVGIVLSNSVYPESFPVRHSYSFDGELRELDLTVIVPDPDAVPTVKSVKYVATTDELRTTQLSQKDQKDRYNNAVDAVALRTLHEVFEADRDRRVESISMIVGTETVDPATGHPGVVPLVAAAVDRERFLGLNLAAVVPRAALEGLSCVVSKNAHGKIPIDTSRGVRR